MLSGICEYRSTQPFKYELKPMYDVNMLAQFLSYIQFEWYATYTLGNVKTKVCE